MRFSHWCLVAIGCCLGSASSAEGPENGEVVTCTWKITKAAQKLQDNEYMIDIEEGREGEPCWPLDGVTFDAAPDDACKVGATIEVTGPAEYTPPFSALVKATTYSCK
jgi:hypothetical protein